MRIKGYNKNLIRPKHGLKADTASAGRMNGMRPEVMPLDEHLDQEIYYAVDRHVNLTQSLPDNHPNKFIKQTLKSCQKHTDEFGI